MKDVLVLKNVTKSYGKKVALRNLNINIDTGKIIGLLGPNGSGKTTLIKTIMRIIRHQQGEITVCNQPVSFTTRSYISFMPDREFLYDSMKIIDSIDYYSDMFRDFNRETAYDLCKKLKLNIEDDIDKLSKGNKEKVVLMLTLARKVPIYLLDEPLGSLDPVIKHEMLSVIKEISNKDNVIIISTHLIKDVCPILDSAILLREGEIASYVEIKNLKKDLEQYYLEVFTDGELY